MSLQKKRKAEKAKTKREKMIFFCIKTGGNNEQDKTMRVARAVLHRSLLRSSSEAMAAVMIA